MMEAPRTRLCSHGIGKRYLRDCTPLKQLANQLFTQSHGTPFWALHPLDFQISAGEAIGVIGRNGSGKSTLLQLLMGALTPTEGTITRSGRVAGILELGTGFNPDFTGRENAVLNAVSLGLTIRQAKHRLPQIEAFAEIGDYFNQPVREYSSGMYARLAFAVVIHVDADILVVDELLSVGDSVFQNRCHTWMRQFRLDGGCLVFVSQNALEVASICPRAIWLDEGRICAEGPSDEIAAAYQASMLAPYQASAEVETAIGDARAIAHEAHFDRPMRVEVGAFRPNAPQHGQGGARIVDVSWSMVNGDAVTMFAGGEEIELRIQCRAEMKLTRPIFGFIFRDDRGQNLFGDNSYLTTAAHPPQIEPGDLVSAVFLFRFPYLPKGNYQLAPSILEGTQDDHIHMHWLEEAQMIRVIESPVEFGLVGVPMIRTALEVSS